MKAIKGFIAWLISAVVLYTIACFLFPTDSTNALILPDWYTIMLAFAPVLCGVFFSIRKRPFLMQHRKRNEPTSEDDSVLIQSTLQTTAQHDNVAPEAFEVEVTYNGLTFTAPKPISNEEYQRKRQAEINALARRYDLSTVEGINAIPVPRIKEQPSESLPSVTGKIEYYLMLKAGQYEKAGKVNLALACYRKANALMPVSSTEYERARYMRLPRYLRQLRRFDEARAEEAKIEQLFGSSKKFIGESEFYEKRNKSLFDSLRREGSDLVEASYIRCCCAECAKNRERVYSVTGKDRRFPRLPEYLLSGEHDSCGIQLYPFIDGVNSMRTRNGKDLEGKAIIKYSNRPFIDDRTPEELKDLAEIEQQKFADLAREQNRIDYDWLWEHLPEHCPKSLSAYSRMKNQKTEKYKALVAEAAKLGYKIK